MNDRIKEVEEFYKKMNGYCNRLPSFYPELSGRKYLSGDFGVPVDVPFEINGKLPELNSKIGLGYR